MAAWVASKLADLTVHAPLFLQELCGTWATGEEQGSNAAAE